MTLTRIQFPYAVDGGKLSLSREVKAASEAIEALIRTGTGEMPLSRDYGADLEYNVPHDVAYGHEERIRQKLAEYHPQLDLVRMTPLVSSDGVILDWACEVQVSG